MKKVYILSFLTFLFNFFTVSHAQINATTYPFSAATATLEDMTTGTTLLVAANLDDGASPVTTIGFDFFYDGVRFTQFSANANGLIRLGSTAVTTSFDNSTVFASLTNDPKIAPYFDDLWTGTNGKVHYKVSGTFPNRKLIIEWLNEQVPRVGTGLTGAGTFQAWMFETSGVIQFVYGSGLVVNATNSGYTIGLQFGTTTNFASVTTTTNTVSYATANNAQTNAIPAGTTYIFTPEIPIAPSNLNFTAVGSASITLNWTDNSTNESGFVIYRSTDGGLTFNFLIQTAADVVTYTNSGLNTSSLYQFRVQALSRGGLSAPLTGNQATTAAPSITSVSSGNWSNPATWSTGTIPTAQDSVTITNGTVVTIDVNANAYAVTVGQGATGILTYESATARNLTVNKILTIAAGGSFNSGAGAIMNHSLTVSQNILNNGSLNLAAGTSGVVLSFNGSENSAFTGTGSVTNLYMLQAAKSARAILIDLNLSSFSVQGVSVGASGALLTTNTGTGTIRFSGTNSFSGQLWDIAAYTIPATLGIWINNPNFSVTALNGTASVSGLFRMTAGTYNVGTGTDNSILFGAGSSVIIEGGGVNVAGRFGVSSVSNAFSYNQSAGALTVCTTGNTSTTFGSFDLGTSTGSVITMSGGTIVCQMSATTFDYRNQAGGGITGITGGTLHLGNALSGTAKAFQVRGVLPNVLLTNTSANHTASYFSSPVNFNNISLNVTISAGTTFDFGNNTYLFNGSTITNNGTISHNGATSNFVLFTTASPVVYTGSGIVSAPLTALAIQSTLGFTIDPASPNIIVSALRLFTGNVTNANKITVGSGGTSTATVQIGNTTTPTAAGVFDVPLTFNAGTGGVSLSLLRTTSVSRTVGNELPSSRILSRLTIDDNDLTHSLTLSPGNLVISASATPTLALTNGKLDLNGNTLTLGLDGSSAALAGAMTTGTPAYMYNGSFKRWISATTGARNFPMGVATAKKDATINFTTVPSAGSLTARWSPVAPAPPAPNLTEPNGNLPVTGVASQGSWFIDAADGLAGGIYTGTFTPYASADVVNYTRAVLIKRPTSGGAWTLDGTHVTTTGSNAVPVLSRTGMVGFSEFGIGGEAIVVVPVSIIHFRGSKLAGANFLDWKVTCTSAPSVTLVLERSGDGATFAPIQTQNATATRCLQGFDYTDYNALKGVNYYRLKVITPDGVVRLSSIVTLLNGESGFELLSVSPNPVRNATVLNVTAAKGGKMEIVVTDIAGKSVSKQSYTVIAGNNNINLNFANLGAGTYNITALNADGEVKTVRFVKL